jgi:hypothetical protein
VLVFTIVLMVIVITPYLNVRSSGLFSSSRCESVLNE